VPESDAPMIGQVTRNDIGGPEELAKAYEATIKSFEEGDIVAGKVVQVDKDEVLLDIGYKSEGVIPARELTIKHDIDPRQVVNLGDEIEALVTQKEDKEGRLILSKKKAQYERAWGQIEKVMNDDGVVDGTVIEVVKGGLIVDIGLRGFLPASLVDLRRVRDLHPFVGKKIEAKIIELDRNRNNVVLSRRKYLEEAQSEGRKKFLEELQRGEVRKGTVSSIVNFGAFVDLGGVDGLVHVSELSWRHVEHPSEVVQVGQEVEVEVLDVDLERERISLSLKKTQEDPWRQFARLHQPGEIIEGQVTKLVPFGAFVRVAEAVEGLVHISELADRHVDTAEQVVAVNENVKVKIIEVDSERRRISLSIKQAGVEGPPIAEEIELEAEEEAEPEKTEVAGEEVLEAALAPEVETAAKPEEDAEAPDHARPLGEETIEAIVADLKRRTQQEG
jgi:small subunit ribosomal protein S1